MVFYVMAANYSELTGSRIYDMRMNKCINTIFFRGKDLLKYFEVHICVKITPRCDTGH